MMTIDVQVSHNTGYVMILATPSITFILDPSQGMVIMVHTEKCAQCDRIDECDSPEMIVRPLSLMS
jgi:hypothetical protein